MLTLKDVRYLLELLREKHGPGYADDPEVAQLQGRLSIMAEALAKR